MKHVMIHEMTCETNYMQQLWIINKP